MYLGFDCSTQGLSAVVIDTASRRVVFRDALHFDSELPQFGTVHGVLPSGVPGVVHAPPLMWKTALQSMFGRLAASPVDVARIRAISGAAQQHGSVYCGDTIETLTRSTAPVWMDSSTQHECSEIEAALGGPQAVSQLTGSRACPRFTGPQIRKFAREDPQTYSATSHIHLVSSYLASLLVGWHAPADRADASGMNLMDIRMQSWSDAALAATALDLARKLPRLAPSATIVGTLAENWRQRFRFPPAAVVVWSGDNPCSLVGTGLLREGDLTVSLGTSDTIFGPMLEPRISADGTGHVFASPAGGYMGITVFSNGSLARERVRDQSGFDWNRFSEALRTTEAGNAGAMMLPWFEPEITPHVASGGPHYFGLENANAASHVRAVIEAQMMALSRHSAWMGVTPRRIHATGGGAANADILQVMADVFDADVQQFDGTDSAALGAALRAYQAHSGASWPTVMDGFTRRAPASLIRPIASHVAIYRRLRSTYVAREQAALATRT
ncbi:MAG: FGGY family carbohydrate kinase [Vicinamibacterales bacterium]